MKCSLTCSEGFESSKSNPITPLCKQRANTYIREQVQTGYLTGETDHQQTWLKRNVRTTFLELKNARKEAQPFQKEGWTTEHHTGSNLQIKTTEKHFKHLRLLLPLILENLTRLQSAHMHLYPHLYLTALSHAGLYMIKHLYFLYYPSVLLTHSLRSHANRPRQVEDLSEWSEQNSGQ